ncbi:MAG: 30S ribosomal protein S17e [Methanobacteriota archaeon]|nr:MAG: 30S ribosomal protein S17e [Euryarchaeota archaeon]
MGRIRPGYIKRVSREILERYGDRLSDDFDRNRAVVDEVVDTRSKRLRNRIAGYLTRLKQQGV